MVLVAVLLFTLLSVSMAAPAVDNAEIQPIVRNKRFIVGHHHLNDIIAQSSCAAFVSHQPYGWVYAVKKSCAADAPTCTKVCTDPKLRAQDPQTAKYDSWRCIGAIHVYGRPPTGNGSPPKLGLKEFYYGYGPHICDAGGHCGPNYCCCVVS